MTTETLFMNLIDSREAGQCFFESQANQRQVFFSIKYINSVIKYQLL